MFALGDILQGGQNHPQTEGTLARTAEDRGGLGRRSDAPNKAAAESPALLTDSINLKISNSQILWGEAGCQGCIGIMCVKRETRDKWRNA